MPLHRKKIDYISGIQNSLVRYNKTKLTKAQIRWIIKRLFHYAALMLTHGYEFTILRVASFKMVYINSDNFGAVERAGRYASTTAIHGVFFTVICTRGWMNKFKATFKPSAIFRSEMTEILSDPDLTYKLVT